MIPRRVRALSALARNPRAKRMTIEQFLELVDRATAKAVKP